MRSMRSEGIGFTPAQTRRMFEAARARPAGEAARRPAERPQRRGAGGRIRRPVRRPIEYTSDEGVRSDGRARHGRGAAAGAFHAARNEAAVTLDEAARAGRADGGGDRLQPRYFAAAVAAAGDATGLHAFQAHA